MHRNPNHHPTMPAISKLLFVLSLLLGCVRVTTLQAVDAPVERSDQWLARIQCEEAQRVSWTDLSSSCEVECVDGKLRWGSIDGGICTPPKPAASAVQQRWRWAYLCSLGHSVPPLVDDDCITHCEDGGRMYVSENDGGMCPFARPAPGRPSAM